MIRSWYLPPLPLRNGRAASSRQPRGQGGDRRYYLARMVTGCTLRGLRKEKTDKKWYNTDVKRELMSEDQKKQLQTQLWNIANELRGKMNADEFRDYILGFIFYKYLSEKMELYADKLLAADNIKYGSLSTSPNSRHLMTTN